VAEVGKKSQINSQLANLSISIRNCLGSQKITEIRYSKDSAAREQATQTSRGLKNKAMAPQ
jgi:hypothetical protein